MSGYIGKRYIIPTFPNGTASPHFSEARGVWNLNQVHNRLNGLHLANAGQAASAWPQSPTRTLTYRTNTTGSGTTAQLNLVHPAGVAIGDLCVLFHAAFDTDSDSLINGPTGFTPIQPFQGLNTTGTTWISIATTYQILTSTANTTLPQAFDTMTTASAPGNQAFVALYFYLDGQSINHVRSIPFFPFPSRIVSGNPTALTNRAGDYPQSCPLLALGSVISTSTTNLGLTATSPNFDLVITNTAATNIEMSVGYKIYNSSPSNLTVDSDSTTTSQAVSTQLLSIRSL